MASCIRFIGGVEDIEQPIRFFMHGKLVCGEEVTDDENSETSYAPVYKEVSDVHYVDVFNGYLYVSAQHGDVCRHHFLNEWLKSAR